MTNVATDPLDTLNAAQREAVEFGFGAESAGPLLVIAGAGSGKTNTLAHRVAHLIATGTDPCKILLLTFFRRAAVEMTRRVDRIIDSLAKVNNRFSTSTLLWSGTFHSVGAKLLREYAGRIGIDPGFTIHDREDSADLMNLVRHELGFAEKEKRFPMKSTCLGIYSAVVNTQLPLGKVLQATYPWCGKCIQDTRVKNGRSLLFVEIQRYLALLPNSFGASSASA